MRKIAVIAAVFALTAAIAGGCGSSGKESSKKEKSEKATNAAAEEATTVAEAEEENTEAATEAVSETVDEALQRKMVEELSPIEWADDESELKTQTVGDDKFGHIDIPEDWFLDEAMSALTDDILAYENEPYEVNGRTAMDTVILEVMQPFTLKDRFGDILTSAAKDSSVTEIATVAEELDGKMSSGVIVKYDDLHKLILNLFVTDDAETEVYFINIETSDPRVIDLYKTFKRPAKES